MNPYNIISFIFLPLFLFAGCGDTDSDASPEDETVEAENYVAFDIRDFGAIANDGIDDAEAIQAALIAARDEGNGARVIIEGGEYLSDSVIILYDNTYLHIDESATLLKAYVSGAANAFIRPAFADRGLDDFDNNIYNGLYFLDDVTITGGGTIRMASKALDGTGSYGPVLLVAGDSWRVNNITIDGYYGTPSLDSDGELVLSDKPEKEYELDTGNGNAIAIIMVGDNHVLRDLSILDGSHSYGTTGIRIHGGDNIYITDCYIESGDEMIATAPTHKYQEFNGSYRINQSPLNQGDITNVHFNNITGFTSAARIFGSIDSHAPTTGPTWGNKVNNVTITNLHATSYKSNHGIGMLNYRGSGELADPFGNIIADNGLLSGFNIIDSTVHMESLPDGVYDYIPATGDYSHNRGFVIDSVADIYIENFQITGDIAKEFDFVNINNVDDISTDNPVIDQVYIDPDASMAYLSINGQAQGDPSAASAAKDKVFYHALYEE